MSKSEDQIRQQLIDARRSQILEAAAQVFTDKGYHRATTKAIADAAGVSEGTIYNYFSSKEDLLISMANSFSDQNRWEEPFKTASHEDFRDAVTNFFLKIFIQGRANDRFNPVILSELLVNSDLREQYQQKRLAPVTALFEANLNKMIESGQMRSMDAAYLARIVFGTFIGLQVLRQMGDPLLAQDNDPKMAELLGSIFCDGIAAE